MKICKTSEILTEESGKGEEEKCLLYRSPAAHNRAITDGTEAKDMHVFEIDALLH